MDTPVEELQRMTQLQTQAREWLDAGRVEEALAAADAALVLEPKNLRSLTLKAEALERQGQTAPAAQLRQLVKQLRREAWQREVEAEIRGHHDLMGEAIRHEQF